MNKFSFAVLGLLVLASPAFAVPVQVTPVEENSPALQLARRVAAMENDKDLPSRAVWLGKKAALNSRLAFQGKPERKSSKKKPTSIQN